MEKQNVGISFINYKLCYNNDFNDVYAPCRYNGWNTFLQCFDIDFIAVFRE